MRPAIVVAALIGGACYAQEVATAISVVDLNMRMAANRKVMERHRLWVWDRLFTGDGVVWSATLTIVSVRRPFEKWVRYSVPTLRGAGAPSHLDILDFSVPSNAEMMGLQVFDGARLMNYQQESATRAACVVFDSPSNRFRLQSWQTGLFWQEDWLERFVRVRTPAFVDRDRSCDVAKVGFIDKDPSGVGMVTVLQVTSGNDIVGVRWHEYRPPNGGDSTGGAGRGPEGEPRISVDVLENVEVEGVLLPSFVVYSAQPPGGERVTGETRIRYEPRSWDCDPMDVPEELDGVEVVTRKLADQRLVDRAIAGAEVKRVGTLAVRAWLAIAVSVVLTGWVALRAMRHLRAVRGAAGVGVLCLLVCSVGCSKAGRVGVAIEPSFQERSLKRDAGREEWVFCVRNLTNERVDVTVDSVSCGCLEPRLDLNVLEQGQTTYLRLTSVGGAGLSYGAETVGWAAVRVRSSRGEEEVVAQFRGLPWRLEGMRTLPIRHVVGPAVLFDGEYRVRFDAYCATGVLREDYLVKVSHGRIRAVTEWALNAEGVQWREYEVLIPECEVQGRLCLDLVCVNACGMEIDRSCLMVGL